MILVLTTPKSDLFETVYVPVQSYDALVALVARIYRETKRPLNLPVLLHKMGGRKVDSSRPTGVLTVGGFKAKITYPGMEDFVAQTYEGKPNVNVIPRLVPDLPDVIRYQEGKR